MIDGTHQKTPFMVSCKILFIVNKCFRKYKKTLRYFGARGDAVG
jgi:hypothetical protein